MIRGEMGAKGWEAMGKGGEAGRGEEGREVEGGGVCRT